MKYIKLYENFDYSFYKNKMYGVTFAVNDGDFELTEIIELGKKLVIFLDKNNVEYRIYYATNGDKRFDPIPDDDYLFFIFNRDIEYEGINVNSIIGPTSGELEDAKQLNYQKIKLEDIPENIEIARIPDNDIEFYFDAKKYNL